ncbi:hypothetical protein BLAT2472_70158 [Burkholderia latens]
MAEDTNQLLSRVNVSAWRLYEQVDFRIATHTRQNFSNIVWVGMVDWLIQLRKVNDQRPPRALLDIINQQLPNVSIFLFNPVLGRLRRYSYPTRKLCRLRC